MLFEKTKKRTGYSSKIRNLLLLLFIELVRTKKETFNKKVTADPIEISLDEINSNFYNNLELNELAKSCGLSTRRYTDLFKQKTGKSCIEYINDLKIEYAKKRLLETEDINLSLLDSGFNDLSHFYKTFKKQLGITPKEFLISHKR